MGQVLRVNYRKTGGVAGVAQLANGMANGLTGSAGINAGGLIYLTSFNGNTYSQSLYAQSAYGIMSAYYGSGLYDSGYAIQILNVVPLSFSDVAGGGLSGLAVTSIRTSGSLVIFQAWVNGAAIASGSTCNFQMLAVVISGP